MATRGLSIDEYLANIQEQLDKIIELLRTPQE
jgi:hypothetical protein